MLKRFEKAKSRFEVTARDGERNGLLVFDKKYRKTGVIVVLNETLPLSFFFGRE